jgi:NADPH:quinone reductase-like Zn-dependent oxidoreductase
VGFFAIQLAELHGYEVVTTCSLPNFDHVKEAGAAYAFDCNDAEVIKSIRDAFPTLVHAFDRIGSVNSSAIAAATLNVDTGVSCIVRPGKSNAEGIPTTFTVTDGFVFTAFHTNTEEQRIGL